MFQAHRTEVVVRPTFTWDGRYQGRNPACFGCGSVLVDTFGSAGEPDGLLVHAPATWAASRWVTDPTEETDVDAGYSVAGAMRPGA